MNNEAIKPKKRGRKSKKELMESLNISYNKINNNDNKINNDNKKNNDNEINNNDKINNNDNDNDNDTDNDTNIDINLKITEIPNQSDKPSVKKRGRKPKGGKIIQNILQTHHNIPEKPNVILHLKCYMHDLEKDITTNNIESFDINSKKELSYELIDGLQNINNINTFSNNNNNNDNDNNINNNDNNNNNNDNNSDVEEDYNNNDIQELWKKIKQLEYNLHINNINNKRSACFWDTCNFDNPPIFIPKHYINESYQVYGCFCSPECAVAYLMNENIDTSTKFERYHLLNHIYSKIYNYKNNIKPAPNPYYMLDKFYGNLSIQEYRSLLKNERFFLIVDKPLTRVLPELHEDNEEFILNNKIIPSNNNNNLKNRFQRRKPNKNSILNEKFGINAD
jgi:hypothetical protein